MRYCTGVSSIHISAQNAEFQIIQALKTNRNKRAKLHEIFVEGTESIKQAIAARLAFTRIIYHDHEGLSDWAKGVLEQYPQASHINMSKDLYRLLSEREELSELIITIDMPSRRLADIELPHKPFVVIFDRPSDTGNFGSLLRSANSFGVDAVLVVGHSIDVYDPKVIRSSLGAIFHTTVVPVDSMAELEAWVQDQKKRNGLSLMGSDSTGDKSLLSYRLQKPIALVLGNEAKGMSVALKNLCDSIASIPLVGEVNSLNVSCAASIFLWDIYRNSLDTEQAVP